ncbi:NAD(P)/FAD-dependent oxidoreductase [Adhaeribacter radiodurans]|uniref:NAD(P)/FAD-dependent oxidoreductase n=1 Tax=Adhaeribacter radiodurans TaxID=2745197 RepID=A0A7L7LBK7_9BACT|nr:NAD(P)/FAD-dependent oxidoreductase [Adhaeribacter radiodurans]QMU30211.1 NAD(P)/FAD-dependent oxidoreductase [Adhaeribacter radiodurans]
MYDVIIVGGGPAGTSAAMLLGRCMRKVLLFDSGLGRNRWSNAMNGFISRDGYNPVEFIKLAREELTKYSIEVKNKVVKHVQKTGNYFEVTDQDDHCYLARKILLATGVKDRVPEIPGIEEKYGKSVHHCPYCDGWESRNKALGAYGKGRDAVGLSLSLKTWSSDVTLYTDGTRKLRREDNALLEANEINICTAPIERLEGEGSALSEIVLQGGSRLKCESLFFTTGSDQQCDLAINLGCDFTSKGVVKTYQHQQTNIPGLYVAGDAARDMQLVIVAASEGTKAGVMINKELQAEFRLQITDVRV